MTKSTILDTLEKLSIVDSKNLIELANKTRDRDGISVYQCKKSSVIFLDSCSHVCNDYYENKQGASYFNSQDRREAIQKSFEDDERRARQIIPIVAGKSWVDIGTGAGGILDRVSPFASRCEAVEPQNDIRESLIELGYQVRRSTSELPDATFDLATLFHVFEHLTDPIAELKLIATKVKKNGRIIIEVPHAKDILLQHFNLQSFKDFTFWSEHLVLHTRQSLQKFIEAAGLTVIAIEGYQRYPLSNHLMWLSKGIPGGHYEWSILREKELDFQYGNMLSKIDQTDTLIAHCVWK